MCIRDSSLVGNLFREEMFSVMTEFLGKVVGWTVKTMFGIVVGFHLIQGLVLPQADAMKNAAVVRTIEAVPGIGAGAGAMSNLLMGSAVLIKNTAGAAAAVSYTHLDVYKRQIQGEPYHK